ncbi:MAG: prepilin-type N-terminal cleavage/methylation domain-containing protein [Gemmatimonadota bacterium]|nr:prepilin-type N-terminal cleavage/methylation domain-containing protein [Gemmatimonadota bacterium]
MDRPMTSLRARLADESGLGLIEVLVSMIILSVGMMAIAGISLQVGTQTKLSTSQTDQSLAAQQVMETLLGGGYAAAASGSDTVSVGNRVYQVTRSVTSPTSRVKLVQLTVTPITGNGSARVYTSRMYENRQLPAAPVP